MISYIILPCIGINVARNEHIILHCKAGFILIHVWPHNAEWEGSTAIVRNYRHLFRRAKQTQVEQKIMSGILQVMGCRGQGYRNCRRMAINTLVQQLCREEEVGVVVLWGCFVGRVDMYIRDRLHLSKKGAAVFADELSATVDSSIGSITNIFGSNHCLN